VNESGKFVLRFLKSLLPLHAVAAVASAAADEILVYL
jgi:hypothetical protein